MTDPVTKTLREDLIDTINNKVFDWAYTDTMVDALVEWLRKNEAKIGHTRRDYGGAPYRGLADLLETNE